MFEEFSFRTRQKSFRRLREETFDFLIIGGGITGAAVARDALSRGFKVALVERLDFASGTSSRSSKLIHGGLRYLENLEFRLVFEALSERAILLKNVPHMVRPLPFYLPVYQGDAHSRWELGLGLWLYDLLALFRTPGFHQSMNPKRMAEEIPFLKQKGLKGGFRYFDASMWDDALAIETLRMAHSQGACILNYVEAMKPLWVDDRMVGYRVRDNLDSPTEADAEVKAHKVIVCAGPWTDAVGSKMSNQWKDWLSPSKGVHLVFDWKRIPIPGALVMSHPSDGRISFVIPRKDLGAGVVIVGTTDGPSPKDPGLSTVDGSDVDYLMSLLRNYFPDLELTPSDILSAYVGVRPLMGSQVRLTGSEGQSTRSSSSLQKVSREHFIGHGPGGCVVVAGGKYTTHRTMAREIVDFAVRSWKRDAQKGLLQPISKNLLPSSTRFALNPAVLPEAVQNLRNQLAQKGWEVPEELVSRYGAETMDILKLHQEFEAKRSVKDPAGLPFLQAQLRFHMRKSLVVRLSDFIFRRVPLYLTRKDHGSPWFEALAQTWGEERGVTQVEIQNELENLKSEIDRNDLWR